MDTVNILNINFEIWWFRNEVEIFILLNKN